jgi:DNA-binding GntR family transcriptional regulator
VGQLRVAAADGGPLYQRLEAVLRDAIAEGKYPVGTLLPAEAELCAQHGVSRHTVREALRRLVEGGLVERRQGAGTRVVAREARRSFVQSMRNIDELFQYAAGTRFAIARRGLAPLSPDEAALILGARAGSKWLRAEGLRIGADGLAICHVLALVHPRFAAIASALPERSAIYAMVEQRFGVAVAEVEQEISAGMLPPEVSVALGRKGRGVGMRFVRRYLDGDGEPMVVSVNWHPGERFAYAMRLRREDDRK